ncbi:UNVERIFIED_CONTAM: hypothetical protein K2H54_011279 [Gekko kuhli]
MRPEEGKIYPISRSRGNGSGCRPSRLLSHEDHQRERDVLRADLEDARRCFTLEVRELREAAARDQQLLVDRLRSRWEQQQARELQQLRKETKKHREAEIRRLLQWKQAELHESQKFLIQEHAAAVRQARELQHQLAKELVRQVNGSQRGSGGVPSAQLQGKLKKVLGKLRWEFNSDQAARIRHLEAQLTLERGLFLQYILGHFEGERWLTGSPHGFRQASLSPEGTANNWGAAGEHTQGGLPQPGQFHDESSHNRQNAGPWNALHALGEICTPLEASALLREIGFPDIQEANIRVSDPPVPLGQNCSGREVRDKSKDLHKHANLLLAKDQQIEALQKECRELQAKVNALQDRAKTLKHKSAELVVVSRRLEAAFQKLQELSPGKENHSLRKTSDSDLLLSQTSRKPANGPSGIVEDASPTVPVGLETSSLAKKKPKTLNMLKKAGDSRAMASSSEAEGYESSGFLRDPRLSQQKLVEQQQQWENLRQALDEKQKECDEAKLKLQKILTENGRIAEERDSALQVLSVLKKTKGDRLREHHGEVEEVEESERSNSPGKDRHASVLSGRPEGMLFEVQAAAPDLQNWTHLTLRNLTTTSAEIAWFPSNNDCAHLVHLNEEKYDVTEAGICSYSFQNLQPSTTYRVKVEPLVPQETWAYPQEGPQQKATGMTFATPSGGPPHAPLDVQVEAGPSAGFLVISWLPETIHPSGSSNGVKVAGYAVYINGQKATEVMSPTAGSVSLDISWRNVFQGLQAVTVRTVSPVGESADSVPTLIPSDLLKVPSTVLSPCGTSGPTSQDFSESEGRPVPAAEDAEENRPEDSLTQREMIL